MKARGEVNPADLRTKHLPSRERVEALVSLFGCEYREGRAAAAPLLRRDTGPDTADGVHNLDNHRINEDDGGGEPAELDDVDGGTTLKGAEVDEDYGQGVPEAGMHDVGVLPHLHDDDQIKQLSPEAKADDPDEEEYAVYEPDNFELIYGPECASASAVTVLVSSAVATGERVSGAKPVGEALLPI